MSRDETKREKAHRLVRKNRVNVISYGGAQEVYEVEGDTSTYLITRRNDRGGEAVCECPFDKYNRFSFDDCSHILAVERIRRRAGV